MRKQHWIAKGFLCLACLLILVCMTQRIAGLHLLQQKLLPATSQLHAPTADSQINAEANEPGSCELSAKSLLSSPPMVFELVLMAMGLLLLLLSPRHALFWPNSPPFVFSCPRLRVHLRLCRFRE